MDRFLGVRFPIVRIGNRMYQYIEDEKLILGYDSSLSALGFREEDDYFERDIDEKEIDSAYSVFNKIAIYKGRKAGVIRSKLETNEIFLSFNHADGEALGIEPKVDHLDKNNAIYIVGIPEKDIPEIYEIRKPIDGFAFESPRIVFHKRDGKWLPWHELGAPLAEDEWL